MRWSSRLTLPISALALALGLVASSTPAYAHHINNCTEGQWNFREAVAEGCSYGHIQFTSDSSGIVLNVTVHDYNANSNTTYLWISWWDNGQFQLGADVGYAYHGVTPVQQTRWFNGNDYIKVQVCNSDTGCSSGHYYFD